MAMNAETARTFYKTHVGPQEVGKVYRSGYWGELYTVLAIHYGDDEAAKAIGWRSWWAITVVGNDERVRMHCTAWDPDRDAAHPEICPCLHPRADHTADSRGHDDCPHCRCPRLDID
ncbi:hypothetical protein [Streptomyces flavidovirens]|uniref:Uncharacterized protein n=1 Tax=Streptomyces flavidovirens TaxID=67298 RepID=A0ABW6RNN4_9ACTN